MHTGDISFCNGVAYNIKSDDMKTQILKRLETKYNMRIICKHYEKFESANVERMKDHPHLICVRSNGNPYFLYLMKHNFTQYCIFIDKKVQHGYQLPRMIIVHAAFNDALFQDTIIDGEMVKTKDGKWFFLCNDLVVLKGQHLTNMNLPLRINALYKLLQEGYTHDPLDLFQIGVKCFWKYGEWEEIMEKHIPLLPYTCRGLYIKPLFLKFKDILYNFNDDLIQKVERIKYKEMKSFILMDDDVTKKHPQQHEVATTQQTINASDLHNQHAFEQDGGGGHDEHRRQLRTFKVRKTSSPDVYELYDQSNVMIGVAGIPSLRMSKHMRRMTQDVSLVDKIEHRFEWSTKFQKWVPFIDEGC